MNATKLVTLSLCAGTIASPGVACVVSPERMPMPPPPPPNYWTVFPGDTDGDGKQNARIAQEVGLFTTTSATNCSCGIGFQNAIVPGLEIDGVSIEIWNKVTGDVVGTIGQFNNFGRMPGADSILGTLPGGGGAQWFGFGGLIPPVGAQALNPNEVIKIVFDVDGGFGYAGGIVFASGEGTADNLPLIGGPHGVTTFSPVDNFVNIPAPGVVVCAGLASIAAFRRRR